MKKFLLTTAFVLLAGVAMAQETHYLPTSTKLTSSELNAKTSPTYIAIKNLSATNNYYFVGNTGTAPYSSATFSNDAVFIWEPTDDGFYLKKLNGTYMQATSPKDFGGIEGAAVFTTTNPTSAGNGATMFNGDEASQSYINGNDDPCLVRFVKGSNWINVQNGNTGTPLYNTGPGGWTIHYVYTVEETIEETIETTETFNWTSSTSWSNVEEYTSTVLSDNKLTNTKDNYTPFVGYIENEITIGGARRIAATFTYTTGNCALNVRGVEVIDANDNIVAGDYHVGKAGNPSNNNSYSVMVAKAGTYKVRCYATFDGDNRSNATNGNITISFEQVTEKSFSHDVTFSAEYATLHLGYQVAVPKGVEAYVVSSVSDCAQLTKVEGVIPAATPVILKNVGTASAYTFEYTTDEAATVETNLLKGSIADRYIYGGGYALGIVEGKIGLYNAVTAGVNDAFISYANKAYLPAAAGLNAVSFYGFFYGDEEDGTTAIEAVVENAETVIFDLAGRKVSEITAPGIYIVNGKKVIK